MLRAEQAERGKDLLVRILFFVWVILLIPWLVIAPLSGMAFDGGNSISAVGFVFSVWTYPIAVFGAFKLLDKSRNAVLLPLINMVAIPVLCGALELIRRRLISP